MPYQGIPDGLYLVRQHSQEKRVDHYGIIDIGNRLRYPHAPQPVVIHQSPPSIRADWLQTTGAWAIVGKIEDEAGAIARVNQAATNPAYDLLVHNCEHFARYVATGTRESTQVQGVVAIAGLVGLVVFLSTRRAA
jgi:hypothetical protein